MGPTFGRPGELIGPSIKPSRRLTGSFALVVVLCLTHVTLAVDAARQHCVTMDEGPHLLSGLLAWERGQFDLYHVNPPLIKAFNTLPWTWSRVDLPTTVRDGFSRGFDDLGRKNKAFLQPNRDRYHGLIVRARVMNVSLSLLGGILLFFWGRGLFGPGAGLVALALWALSPVIIGWAGVCTVDLGSAVVALAASYTFWLYLRSPNWSHATLWGWTLGLALLSKFTLLVLPPVFVVVWVIARIGGVRAPWSHLVVSFLIALVVLNAGYNFRGTGRALREYAFQSQAFRAIKSAAPRLDRVPVPLPEAFVLGLDEQESHTDRPGSVYLGGRFLDHWPWYFYAYVLGVKMPAGALGAAGLALVLAVASRRHRARAWEEWLVLLPAIAVLMLLSHQMRNIHASIRYVLAALPFLFLATARVGALLDDAWSSARSRSPRGWSLGGAFAVVAALALVGHQAWRYHPHELEYFNEFAGGPDHGAEHLVASNIDWGQDLFFLKRWAEEHPEARPLALAYHGGVEAALLGVDLPPVPRLGPSDGGGPPSGWYAISVDRLFGDKDTEFAWFRRLRPVAKAGYSIFIFHVREDEGGPAP